jgi:RNA polymerase-binding transcription factor DksA
MNKDNRTKEQLIKRRDEILNQLNRTERDLRIELDRDPEEQALQIEQDQVSITMEANLRKELVEIEDRLAEMEEEPE